ncbi:DUF4835 family protein [Parabacteroides sp. 52]|uniref:type IX secretion system protein PorD n=2 Tax=unclassified Parabacteroides TaxID=2649774 RepID=UPI0013D82C09|nr:MULTISPECIES: DUF4835 family protein [unclassified Parabacteroides]MDH6533811.1 hypothetical protein [Parabacteroides sp. PM5-20]NDV54561.1 DUF4835 family protein [Parabacteroides sp. 52]
MKTIKRIVYLAFVCILSANMLHAQEFNAKVTVNSDKVAVTDKAIFTTLQNALMEFINNKVWTDATFNINERIDCTMTIVVNELTDTNFKSEIQVQVRRPVYNASYTTTLFNFRDRQFDFEYTEFEPLEFSGNMLNSNLTATIVFYLYTILGLDFDSFSPKGGNTFLQQAQQIVSLAQSQVGWSGWKAFDNNQNRHALITALTDNTSDLFHEMWYTYHRKGLDEMVANPDRGRATLISSLSALQQIKSARPSSLLLQMFAETKLDEVVAIYSKATTQEKQEGLKMLSALFPTETKRLEALNK